jgi:hypothetical protein
MSDPVEKDPKDMTPEELQALMERLGVNLGGWNDVEEKDAVPPMVTRQLEALVKLRAMLQGMAENDAKRVTALREQLARLEYGGGS